MVNHKSNNKQNNVFPIKILIYFLRSTFSGDFNFWTGLQIYSAPLLSILYLNLLRGTANILVNSNHSA